MQTLSPNVLDAYESSLKTQFCECVRCISIISAYSEFCSFLNRVFSLYSQTFQDEGLSNYIVVYLRLLTSAQLQRKSDFFENFIEGGRTTKEFCSQVCMHLVLLSNVCKQAFFSLHLNPFCFAKLTIISGAILFC